MSAPLISMSNLVLAYSLCAVCLLASWALTGWIRRLAMQSGMLDRPNERSSHTVPTPRGGGLAVLVATSVALVSAIFLGLFPATAGIALLTGYLAVGWIGWRDDRHGVPASIRLLVHLLSAAWLLVVSVGTSEPGITISSVGAVAAAGFLWIAMVWAINLFNFMDGTDGIAASQAVFMSLMGALIAGLQGAFTLAVLLGVLAAGTAGFLIWNWQPARIFMGDVGSGSLGFMLAAAPVSVFGLRVEMLWPWAILWTTFAVDATVTLLRRALGRQRIFDAHRSHAYQILARRWRSHARVALAFSAVNLLWVAPLSIAAALAPQTGAACVALAAFPLVALAWRIGAGRPDA